MPRAYVPLLLIVAGIWGAWFMFIKVAVDEIDPAALMALRLLLAALVLVPVLLVREGVANGLAELRSMGSGALVLGVANNALPFTLIAWGETHIDSGIAAIANAPVPIFVALLALRFQRSERATGLRLVGIVVGFAGVAVLAGLNPQGGWWAAAGTLAVTAAALCYACSNVFTQSRLADRSPVVIAAGSTAVGALVLLPFGLWQLPDEVPSSKALASVAALGVLGTAVALLFFFRMLKSYGASRAALVTYLVPVTALVYGVTLLGEPLAANAIAGLVLILAGVALGSGVFRVTRARERDRDAVPAAPRA